MKAGSDPHQLTIHLARFDKSTSNYAGMETVNAKTFWLCHVAYML